MNKEHFLNLSEVDQQKSISEFGNLVINFLQGDTNINFYKVNELFVKVITKQDGYRRVEVNTQIPAFRLSEFWRFLPGWPRPKKYVILIGSMATFTFFGWAFLLVKPASLQNSEAWPAKIFPSNINRGSTGGLKEKPSLY